MSNEIVRIGDHVIVCDETYEHMRPLSITDSKEFVHNTPSHPPSPLIPTSRKVKFGKANFPLNTLIGAKYGSKFMVDRDRLVLVEDVQKFEIDREEIASGSDNREIEYKVGAQKLSMEDINDMKRAGHAGKEILSKLVASSESFQLKTEFSQEKYISKKAKKYMQHVIVRKPTTRLLADMYFTKMPSKICLMRPDSLTLMLSRGNIRANARVLIAETTTGLLTGAVLERMGGMGEVLQIHSGEHHCDTIIDMYNFKNERSILSFYSMELLSDGEAPISEASDAALKARSEEKFQLRLQRRARNLEIKASLKAGGFHSLLIAVKYHPGQLLRHLWPSLALSCPFVIFSPYIEPLTECFMLSKQLGAANVTLGETWFREYQVLEMRTHPVMTTSAASGFLLSGIKVDNSVNSSVREESVRAQMGETSGSQSRTAADAAEEHESDDAPNEEDGLDAKRARDESED